MPSLLANKLLNRRSSFGGTGIAPLLHTMDSTCISDRRSSLGSSTGRRSSFSSYSGAAYIARNTHCPSVSFIEENIVHKKSSTMPRSSHSSTYAANTNNPNSIMSRQSSSRLSTRRHVNSSDIFSVSKLTSNITPSIRNFTDYLNPIVEPYQGRTSLPRHSSLRAHPSTCRFSGDSVNTTVSGISSPNWFASSSNDSNIMAITSALNDVKKISVEVDMLRDHMRRDPMVRGPLLQYEGVDKRKTIKSSISSNNTSITHSVDELLNDVFV